MLYDQSFDNCIKYALEMAVIIVSTRSQLSHLACIFKDYNDFHVLYLYLSLHWPSTHFLHSSVVDEGQLLNQYPERVLHTIGIQHNFIFKISLYLLNSLQNISWQWQVLIRVITKIHILYY